MEFRDIRATLEIDLNKAIEDLWNNLDKDARWGTKKAVKEGLTIYIAEAESSEFEKFYEIYKETILRGGIVPTRKEELQKGIDKLFICIKDKKIIAGAAIKILDEKVELFLNASKYEYLKFQPNNLLYWNIIDWSKKKGFKVFDLGGYQLGSKPGDKLYHVNRFKERWGGTIKKYGVKSKNPLYILGRKIIRNFGFVKKTRDAMKVWIYKNKNLPNKIKENIKNIFKKIIYDKKEIIVFSNLSHETLPLLRPKIDLIKKNLNFEETRTQRERGYPFTKKIKKRFEGGDLCFGYFNSLDLVHSSWVCLKEMNISETKTKIPLLQNQACIYDCYTSENYRKKGIYSAMLSEIKRELFGKGFQKIYIYVDSKNIGSINGIEKSGFKRDFLIKYSNLFGISKRKTIKFKKED